MLNYFLLFAEEGAQTPPNTLPLLIVMGVLLVGMYVMMSISQKKRQKKMNEMINQLQPGNKIKTIGGIFGTIVESIDEDNAFVIETGSGANKSYLKIDKSAVYASDVPAAAPAEEQKEEASVEVVEETTEE